MIYQIKQLSMLAHPINNWKVLKNRSLISFNKYDNNKNHGKFKMALIGDIKLALNPSIPQTKKEIYLNKCY